MRTYTDYSKEELIQEIERLKQKDRLRDEEYISESQMLVNIITLRRTISEVLALLLGAGDNSVINRALLRILDFFTVDRVYIGIFDDTNNMVDFTHEVTSDGVISMREDLLRQLSRDEIPWWTSLIKEGQDIIVHNVSEMQGEAAAEQHLLELQEVVSLLALPVLREGKAFGFIGLDAVNKHRVWSALDVENLRILADIISIAIEREHNQRLIEHSTTQMLTSESKFRIIFEKLPWGIELYDAEGVLLDLNDADLKIFKTTKESALGVNIFKNPNIPKWVHDKVRKGEDVKFTLHYDFISVKETHYYETGVTDTVKHLQVKGVALKNQKNEISGYLYIVYDDTENYRKAEETQYNLAKLKVAVNTGDSIIWECDVATEKLTVDYSLTEELSFIKDCEPTCIQDFLGTLHPDDFDKVYNQQFKRLLKGEIDNYVSVYRRILNGKLYWFNSNVRTYKFNADGTPSKVVCYASNITKQRESENELIRVIEADKLKSAFLANMSHEIRTPLNAIVGFSDIIAETEDTDEKQEFLNIIHKNNELLLHLIDDILDFSRIEAGILTYHIAEADIKGICEEIYQSSTLKMKPDVKLLFDKHLPSIWFRTDTQRIMQVISNFVNNAIKFTAQGSITIAYKEEQDNLFVSVSDTGIGIAEQDRVRIFERFIKINDFRQGTGLGLTISKTIIENLGGEIGVHSKKGSGSTFWFTLPLHADKAIQ